MNELVSVEKKDLTSVNLLRDCSAYPELDTAARKAVVFTRGEDACAEQLWRSLYQMKADGNYKQFKNAAGRLYRSFPAFALETVTGLRFTRNGTPRSESSVASMTDAGEVLSKVPELESLKLSADSLHTLQCGVSPEGIREGIKRGVIRAGLKQSEVRDIVKDLGIEFPKDGKRTVLVGKALPDKKALNAVMGSVAKSDSRLHVPTLGDTAFDALGDEFPKACSEAGFTFYGVYSKKQDKTRTYSGVGLTCQGDVVTSAFRIVFRPETVKEYNMRVAAAAKTPEEIAAESKLYADIAALYAKLSPVVGGEMARSMLESQHGADVVAAALDVPQVIDTVPAIENPVPAIENPVENPVCVGTFKPNGKERESKKQ